MRVLVTGASGFIGGVLCGQLLERDHEVVALVRRAGTEPAGTRGLLGDLADGPSLTGAVASTSPDCVIHLAAQIASQRSERKVREVNVGGTERLVQACLALSRANPSAGPRVVFSSTVVTGDARGALLTEDEPLPCRRPTGAPSRRASA
jgi:nucleoside-diphosphate-sugar epimerase